MTDTVEVKLDPELHKRTPETVIEGIAWPVLDTAFNLLRDAAVKVVLQELRTSAAEQGAPFPATDEELFKLARESGDPDAPTSYRDLAPESMLAAEGLHAVFLELIDTATLDAQQGMVDSE